MGMECEISRNIHAASTSPLSTGTVITYQFLGVGKDNAPKHAYLHSIHSDSHWEDVTPYRLSYGSTLGTTPKCRGCSKSIKRREKLRVQVIGTYQTSSTEDRKVITYSFCNDPQCLQAAKNNDLFNRRVYYPTFRSQIILSPQIRAALPQSELRRIEALKQSGINILEC
jgi:hypothetical protein